MRTKRKTVLCATLLVPVLVGCGSDGDGTAAQTQEQGEGSGLSATLPKSASTPDPTEPTIDFSGLVQVGNWFEGGVLRVADPMNPGAVEPETEIELPYSEAGYTRESFSADWQYAAWTTDSGAVQVGELDAAQRRYVPSFTIKPTKSSYSTRSTSYDNPRFSPDGETLWLETVVENEDLTETLTLASVPYADYRRGDEPELSNLKTSDLPGTGEEDWWMFDQNGDPMLIREQDMQEIGEEERDAVLADYWMDQSGSIVKLEIGASTYPEENAYLGYEVVERLGPNGFVVAANPDGIMVADIAEKYGVVAKATVDTTNQKVSLDPMVPLGVGGLPEWVMLSPDQTEALLCVRNERSGDYVPYLASLQPGVPEPEQLSREECADTGQYTQLGWY